jgi:hypothetical protein
VEEVEWGMRRPGEGEGKGDGEEKGQRIVSNGGKERSFWVEEKQGGQTPEWARRQNNVAIITYRMQQSI